MPHIPSLFAMLTCSTMVSVAAGQTPPDPTSGLLRAVSAERVALLFPITYLVVNC